MKTNLILLCTFLLHSILFSNPGKEFDRKYDRAEALYKGGNYAEALTIYNQLFLMDSSNCNICYKAGVCYLKSGKNYKQAVRFLEKASASVSHTCKSDSRKERNAPASTFKYLAEAYHLNYDFSQAVSSYEKYKEIVSMDQDIDKAQLKEIDKKIQYCKNGSELIRQPAEVKIINLGKNINTTYPDYCPRISADECTMIFTSKRPENTGGNTYDGGQFFEDIYISTRADKHSPWGKAINLGQPVNTVGNEAAIAISPDAQEILIYKDDMGDGNIYSSRLNGDKWSVPPYPPGLSLTK